MSAPGLIVGLGTVRRTRPFSLYWWAVCDWAHFAGVVVDPSEATTAGEVGAKPPSNQPQVTPFRFRRSPTFRPCISTVPLPVAVPPASAPQSSSAGSGSPVTVTGLKAETAPFAKAVAR